MPRGRMRPRMTSRSSSIHSSGKSASPGDPAWWPPRVGEPPREGERASEFPRARKGDSGQIGSTGNALVGDDGDKGEALFATAAGETGDSSDAGVPGLLPCAVQPNGRFSTAVLVGSLTSTGRLGGASLPQRNCGDGDLGGGRCELTGKAQASTGSPTTCSSQGGVIPFAMCCLLTTSSAAAERLFPGVAGHALRGRTPGAGAAIAAAMAST